MGKPDVLKKYLEFRSLKNHSKNGLGDIKFHINKFLTHSRKPLNDFNEDMLTKYINKINQEYKTNTSNTIKSSFLKNFIKWHYEDWSSRFRNLDVICATEKPAPTYNPEDMLSEEDVKKLITEEDNSFWKAYFLTLFYGACRPIEVVTLKHEAVEFEDDGAYITIYSKKNKRSFIKFVPSDVAFYLKKLRENGSEYIFCNPRTKKPISVKGAYWKLKQMSKKSLGKEINLYILRHSIATIIYNRDDIKDDNAAAQMGHSKSMKQTYVHNDKNKLKENARKIYFKPEELPPEKKAEMEREIEKLQDNQKKMAHFLEEIFNDKQSSKGEVEVQKNALGVLLKSMDNIKVKS